MQGVKAVILAGGLGSRLAEETGTRPKPMVEIGGKPILWHIMKIFHHHGVRDFVICLGYKGHMIKEYFLNYAMLNSDITVETHGRVTVHNKYGEDWSITLADTGEGSMTGGRLGRVRRYLEPGKPFFMTYGDGVGDVDITALYDFHMKHGKLATITGVRPNARFGALEIDGDAVRNFREKPESEGGYINGGFFVLETTALSYITGDDTVWERTPLEKLATTDNLRVRLHDGFWQPMDTQRDKLFLEDLWNAKKAPWKLWKD